MLIAVHGRQSLKVSIWVSVIHLCCRMISTNLLSTPKNYQSILCQYLYFEFLLKLLKIFRTISNTYASWLATYPTAIHLLQRMTYHYQRHFWNLFVCLGSSISTAPPFGPRTNREIQLMPQQDLLNICNHVTVTAC